MKKSVKYAKQNTFPESALFKEIRELILSARKAVVRNVDTIQVLTNFEIGRRIVEVEQKGEQKAEYGKTLIKALADKLIMEFGNGFSKRNLDYMRKFYLTYHDRCGQIVQTLSAQFKKCQMSSGKLQKTQTPSAQLQEPDKASRILFSAERTAKRSLKLPYPKTAISTPKNTVSICRQKQNSNANSLTGPKMRRSPGESISCGQLKNHLSLSLATGNTKEPNLLIFQTKWKKI